ncbi:MAG: hypothetical protein RIC85_00670 [Gammaproteobacteria bacterium]
MQKGHKRIPCPSGDGSYWTIRTDGLVPMIEHHTRTGKVDSSYATPALRYASDEQLPIVVAEFADAAVAFRTRRQRRCGSRA